MKKLFVIIFLLVAVQVQANTSVFNKLPERKLLALMIYGEARSSSLEGKIAVASVAMERAENVERLIGKEKNLLKKIILKPKQFSCFNESDLGYYELFYIAHNWDYEIKNNSSLRKCYTVAKGILNKTIQRHPLIQQYRIQHYMVSTLTKDWESGMRVVFTLDGHKYLVIVNDYWIGYKKKK